MEYETVKQKEKKISVKICKGGIWEELKYILNDKKCEEDKKNDKKKLTVDIIVKREFRSSNESNSKDDSWMNRIKTALIRSKYQEQISTDKKDSANKQQKKDTVTSNKPIKQVDKKVKEDLKGGHEPENVHEPDLVKEESHNILNQTKKRISGNKNKEQLLSEPLKGKKGAKVSQDDVIKEKQKIDWPSIASTSGEANKEKEKSIEDGLKSSRQKGNKYEVQINNNVVVINPNESDEESKDVEEKEKKQQITKDKRSKSKPATAKEKWIETAQGKKFESVNEPTLEAIKNLKSSILSLRVVDKKLNKNSNDKDKLRDYRTKREEEKKKRKKDDEDLKSSSNEIDCEVLPSPNVEPEIKVTTPEKKRKNHEVMTSSDKSLSKTSSTDKSSSNESKKRKDKKEKIKDNSQIISDLVEKEASTSNKIFSLTEEEPTSDDLDVNEMASVNLVNEILDERLPIYSSSCYSGSSSSEEQECSCGCMDSNPQSYQYMSDSSPSSSSSIEYLRSYSGNLIMCAHGKKPVLSEHIRYLSSCIKS